MDDKLELLTEDADGHAVEGFRLPRSPLFEAIQYVDRPDGEPKIAHVVAFFRYDDDGRAIPSSAVDFFVPSHMVDHGKPSLRAQRLVSERMGSKGYLPPESAFRY